MTEELNTKQATNHSVKAQLTKAMAIIYESFQLTSGLKWPIFKRNILLVLLTGLTFLVLFYVYLRLIGATYYTASFYLNISMLYILILIQAIIIFKLYIPIFLMGVKQALGVPVDINLIKYECSTVKKELFKLVIYYSFIFATYAFITIYLNSLFVLNILKLVLSLIFMLIFTPICLLSIPLITTEKKSFNLAINIAYNKYFLNWIPILGSYFIFTIITATISITLRAGALWLAYYIPIINKVLHLINIIPSIWLLPMLVIIGGIIYRDIFILKNYSGKTN